MKKVTKSILTFLLAVSILTITTPPAIAANTRNHIDYVALGDSCAAGVLFGDPNYPDGGSGFGYTDNIAKKLEEAGLLFSFNKDFAVSGETAEVLAAKTEVLNIPDTAEWHLIKDAEIVTLDIGANDLLIPLYNYIIPLIEDPDSDWYTNQPAVAYHLTNVILPEILMDLYGEKGTEIEANIEKILQNILNANKNVRIYVMGYYNPLPALQAGGMDINGSVTYLNTFIINAISHVIDNNKGASIAYVDTMTAMGSSAGNLLPIDIHPTVQGYQTIAEEFWNKIESTLIKTK